MINGKTKVFGLFGNPIEHTISPYIHQLLYNETGYNGTYNPFFVPTGMLEEAVKGMKGMNIKGVNVTVPYKVSVMDYLDEVDDMAANIGAVNTIVPEYNEDKNKYRLKGYNTDWIGLSMQCDYDGIPIKNRDIVIVGAGGSERSVAFMCIRNKAKSITLMNRTLEKAEILRDHVKQVAEKDSSNSSVVAIEATELIDSSYIKEGSIVFQTTSAGMYPNVDLIPIESESFFNKVDFIVDIIYNPKETAFMRLGKSYGAKVANGLGMLFFQAVKAFELWTEIKLEKDQLERVLGELEQFIYDK